MPPLLKHLVSSIYWQLCIISSPKLCLHICFHGQKMLSYEYVYMCMKMRTAIIEKPNVFNIWKTMHDNIMNMVSTHMFPWSRIIIISLKMLQYNRCICVCKGGPPLSKTIITSVSGKQHNNSSTHFSHRSWSLNG